MFNCTSIERKVDELYELCSRVRGSIYGLVKYFCNAQPLPTFPYPSVSIHCTYACVHNSRHKLMCFFSLLFSCPRRMDVSLCWQSWRQESTWRICYTISAQVDRRRWEIWTVVVFVGSLLRQHRQGARCLSSLSKLCWTNRRKRRHMVLHRVRNFVSLLDPEW